MRSNEQIINKKIKSGKLYYITQYASYMSDNDYYGTLKECLNNNFTSQALEEPKVNYIMDQLEILINDKMPSIGDYVNKKVFELIYMIKSSDDIDMLNGLYDAIINEDIDALNDITSYSLYDYMGDYNILTPDAWEEIADHDLKQNGASSNALYWVKKINYDYDFLQMNGYENGFYEMDAADVIHEFLTDYYDFNNLI